MSKTPAFVLLGLMAVNAFGADTGVFRYRVGRFDVYTLVENRGAGRDSILIGVDADTVKRYLGSSFESEVNTFLIRAPGRNILVDTGFGTTIFESMKTLGLNPGEIDAVLLTHLHGDHIGGLQRDGKPLFPNAKVYLARQEREYWTRTNLNRNAVDALTAYGAKVETFLPGEAGQALQELLPGITAIAAFGHTPGHTAFQVESDGERLLIWGDLMHIEGIQFPLPDVSVTYDTDPVAAAASRKKILAYAASNNIPIAGMHLIYPAIGSVRAQDKGYRLIPAK
jgi:glyoxylase-like metal-dependent hydrolase (beta-lactamase superfamily II)